MTTKLKHTPWHVEILAPSRVTICDRYGEELLEVSARAADVDNEANAARIVRAVNAHDALVEALKKISDLPSHACDDARNQAALTIAIKEARSALAVTERKGSND